jgi:very-short-patch-repair endonuclease
MKFIYNNPLAKPRRQELRNRLTPQEAILWNHLKHSKLGGYKFRRQTSVGPYIADFYCPLKRLIIELDGSQHLENEKYDRERDSFLQSQGCIVLRFWNNEVDTNLNGVIMKIMNVLENKYHPGLRPPLLK